MIDRMANWFIGLPIAPEGWFESVPAPPPACRLFAPTDLHLTVAFLGTVTEDVARAAWAATRWIDSPETVTLGAAVPMGSARRWSALSVLLGDGRVEVEAAIGRSRGAAFDAARVRPDDRPPKAHVTIARPKRSATSAERAAALAWAETIVLPSVRVTVATIALYTWSEDRERTLFRVVECASLPRR
jgi:2'-5' RNA ligase